MEIKYGVQGKERKKLAESVGTFLKADVEYLGVPSCSYKIRSIEIDRNGTMIIGNRMSEDTIKVLLEHLKEEGYKEGAVSKSKVAVPKTRPTEEAKEEVKEEPKEEPKEVVKKERVKREHQIIPNDSKIDGYVISFPLENYDEGALSRLKSIIDSKANLMKKVFETDDLSFKTENNELRFEWFNGNTTPEELKAYSEFLAKLCHSAKEQQRVNATEKPIVNERYQWRCFLLRLELIGPEFKETRAILMKNLSGNSAWRVEKDEKSE